MIVQEAKNVKNIYIPSTVEDITINPFINLSGLQNIEVSPENRKFVVKDGILFSKDMTTVICYPSSLTNTKYEVNESVNKILKMSFRSNKNLKTLKFSGNITEIPMSTMAQCSNLENIYFPESLKDIGNNILAECRNVKRLVIYGDLNSTK